MHGGSELSDQIDQSELLFKQDQSYVANLIGDQSSDLSEYHEIKPIDFKSV